MKNIRWKNRLIVLSGLLALAFCAGGGVAAFSAGAVDIEPHADCNLENEYCLVCDVAGKINALPSADEITIENAAQVTQQIHDIDRIKYDLTDDEFDELRGLVTVENYGDVVKYNAAVSKVQEVQGNGGWFAVSKSFDLGDETLQDTSSAQVSFSLTNVDTNANVALTLFDLAASTSALGDEYYQMTADGWFFAYNLPAGTYYIQETNLDKAVTVNEKPYYFACTAMSDGVQTVNGNGLTFTIEEGGSTIVSVLNSLPTVCYKVQDAEGNAIEGVVISGDKLSGYSEDARTTGADGTFSITTSFGGDTLTVSSVPTAYCTPNQISYTFDGTNVEVTSTNSRAQLEGALDEMMGGYMLTLTLQRHAYGDLIESTVTCTTDGVEAHYQCADCEKYFDEEKNETLYENLVKTAQGHDYGTRIGEIPASCTMSGIAAHYHCGVCDAYFDDEQTEVAYEDLILDALGHDYGDWTVTTEPTPNEDGEKERSCSRCGGVQTEVISATGYDATQTEWMYLLIIVGGVLLLAALSAVVIDTGRREL